MDQRGARLDATDQLAAGVVPEGADVAVRADRAVCVDPGGAPAVAGEPEPLETLAEVPQGLEKKRLRGARDELLAHALDDRRGSPAPVSAHRANLTGAGSRPRIRGSTSRSPPGRTSAGSMFRALARGGTRTTA